jgi:dTDP-4-dehydrorhamnose reductase
VGTPPAVRPLILGAGGLLGRSMSRVLEHAHPATVSATRAELDVTDRFRLEWEVERLQPTVLVNCAAFSDPDGCEIDADRARRVNVTGAENAARAAAGAGCRMVQMSTVAVFDGRAAHPYAETFPPAPICEYGRTMLEGERRVARCVADHLIVRTSWPLGRGGQGFLESLRRRVEEGGPIPAVVDERGSPTCADDLAEAVLRLLGTERLGTVHFANTGAATRYQVARVAVEAMGADPDRVRPVRSEEAGWIARRPVFAVLQTSLYSEIAGCEPRPWEEALRAGLSSAPVEGPRR